MDSQYTARTMIETFDEKKAETLFTAAGDERNLADPNSDGDPGLRTAG